MIFPVNPESNEELIAKMKSFEMELVEMEETTLSEEQVWFGLYYVLKIMQISGSNAGRDS